jgi:Protein of unknown function (DUF732)
MFTSITTRAGSSVTAIVVLTGAAMLRGGAASADSNQDDQFLALLTQQGVPAVSGAPSLIATAHEICRNLDAGMSADALVDALVNNANSVTPGADPGRLARTEARFLTAAVEAYCPNDQGKVAFTNPAGWNESRRRVMLASLIEGASPANPTPPPRGPQAQKLRRPQAVAPPPPKKVAPPVVGPPPGSGGGGGGNGGGTGGVAPTPPMGPGIITLGP